MAPQFSKLRILYFLASIFLLLTFLAFHFHSLFSLRSFYLNLIFHPQWRLSYSNHVSIFFLHPFPHYQLPFLSFRFSFHDDPVISLLSFLTMASVFFKFRIISLSSLKMSLLLSVLRIFSFPALIFPLSTFFHFVSSLLFMFFPSLFDLPLTTAPSLPLPARTLASLASCPASSASPFSQTLASPPNTWVAPPSVAPPPRPPAFAPPSPSRSPAAAPPVFFPWPAQPRGK